MVRKVIVSCLLVVTTAAVSTSAQTLGLSSFLSPYRTFDRVEFGGHFAFDEGTEYAVGGFLRGGVKRFDIGARLALIEPDGPGDLFVAVGVDARQQLVRHNEDFPLDGAIVVGAAGLFPQGDEIFLATGGFSLGRRLQVEDSDVTVTPYVEPVLLITDLDELDFALGIGADVGITDRFTARISVGLGEIEGVSLGVAWSN